MDLSGFDLNLLRVLDAILREGSTVRAGQRIGLSQPAVSAALGRLRQALGDPLFVRHGQRLVPTDFARGLELPLHDALAQLQAILSRADSFDPARSEARFRLSGSDFFALLLMPRLAKRLAAEAPGVRVHLLDLLPEDYVGTIERYEVDLALIPQAAFPEWTAHRPLFRSPFVMIARCGHPRLDRAGIAPGDPVPIDLFCDLDHLLFSVEGKARGMGDAALDRIGRARRVVMTLPAFSGICMAVAQSDAVALVPHQLAAALGPVLGLKAYLAPMPLPEPVITMIWHRRASLTPAHRWLRGVIADLMGPLNDGFAPLAR